MLASASGAQQVQQVPTGSQPTPALCVREGPYREKWLGIWKWIFFRILEQSKALKGIAMGYKRPQDPFPDDYCRRTTYRRSYAVASWK